MKVFERTHSLNRAASDAARSGEPSRGETVLAWLLAAPVILPVVVYGEFIYPYLVPKTLLFYALTLITVAVFIILVAHGRAFFWARLERVETWIPGALLALAYLTSALGIDFYRSFWSVFVRGDGLLMLTCAVVSFYLILLYADRIFFVRLLYAVATVASAVAVYGIGEWLINGGRVGGLLGNAAFFAGYLGVAFFATLAATQFLSGVWRRVAYAGAAFQVIAIILSATRGTILALVASSIVALIYSALRAEGSRRRWSAITFVALVAAGGLFFALRSELAQSSFAPIARVASIGTADKDVASRLFIWKNIVADIQTNPWKGVGAEHIDVLFNQFYDQTQIGEEWFDRSHNAFLDYAAQYGVFGLVLYVVLIVLFFVAALRLARRGQKRIAGLVALLACTYAVQNFFVFDTVSSFWLLLALLASVLAFSRDDPPRAALRVPLWARYGSWPLALTLVLLIIPVSIQPALAAYDLSEAYLYQIADVGMATSYLSHGIALGTYGDLEYGYEAYDMYTSTQALKLSGGSREAAYQAALAILTNNFNRYPYDARTALYLVHVLTLAPPGITIDRDLLSAGLTRGIKESPKRSQLWYIFVNLSISDANTHPIQSPERAKGYAAAQDILTRYIALVPTLSEPHFVLAQLLRASGDMERAAAEAAQGKSYYISDLATARRAAGYYEGAEDWPSSSFFLGEVVRLAPLDSASNYDLAKTLYLSGNPADAEAIVARLRVSSPATLATDQKFLDAMTAYEQSTK